MVRTRPQPALKDRRGRAERGVRYHGTIHLGQIRQYHRQQRRGMGLDMVVLDVVVSGMVVLGVVFWGMVVLGVGFWVWGFWVWYCWVWYCGIMECGIVRGGTVVYGGIVGCGVVGYYVSCLPDTGTGERSQELQRSGLGGGGGDNDGVLHGVVLLEGLDELGDGGSLLTDGDVDTVELLGLVGGVVPPLLVEDGIQSDGGLSGLTITDNQLTLATADGDHSIDGLETGLDGLVDRATGQNAGGLDLSTGSLLGVEGTLAVNGVTEGVDDTAEQLRADGHIDLVGVSKRRPRDIARRHDIQFHRYA